MQTSTGFPAWWFPILFVGMWVAISTVVAFVGGWHRLARRYRGAPTMVVDRIRAGSGHLGDFGAHYNNCLVVSVGPGGVGLKVWLPFRLFHPPLLIPWGDVVKCERWRMLGIFERTRLRLVDAAPSIVLYGRAARLVGDAAGAVVGAMR